MIMKIENNNLNPVAPQQRPEGVHASGKGTQVDRSGSKDRAELSEQARLLAKARVASQETPDVRSDRVQELKQQIASGAYSIPYQDLARRLLPVVSNQKE
jgi:flagellar biosynthesis anti-sigma factor FlgM